MPAAAEEEPPEEVVVVVKRPMAVSSTGGIADAETAAGAAHSSRDVDAPAKAPEVDLATREAATTRGDVGSSQSKGVRLPGDASTEEDSADRTQSTSTKSADATSSVAKAKADKDGGGGGDDDDDGEADVVVVRSRASRAEGFAATGDGEGGKVVATDGTSVGSSSKGASDSVTSKLREKLRLTRERLKRARAAEGAAGAAEAATEDGAAEGTAVRRERAVGLLRSAPAASAAAAVKDGVDDEEKEQGQEQE